MSEPASSLAIVITTCASRSDAESIARELVGRRLAACVQMCPIDSIYRWQGAIEQAQEVMLFCKIKSQDYAAVEAAIQALHSYETPEIVEIAIDKGLPAYLRWIATETR
jgi:periplasmic divalent cation tolerance protein